VSKNLDYAVGIRDEHGDLWLHKWIRRTQRGDIFVLWPFARSEATGLVHATYHADGRLHIKTDNQNKPTSMPLPPQYKQKLDANFKNCQGIVMTPISLNETRSWGEICDPLEYDSIFEVPYSTITPENALGDFQLDVTVVEPGRVDLVKASFQGPLQTMVTFKEFNDREPWLVTSVCRI
jgi:hypothetical protein